MKDSQLSAELQHILGAAGFIALAEAHGGTRFYVPADAEKLSGLLVLERAERLVRRFGGSAIRMPLAREVRARHYRAQGHSNSAIARKLMMTETGVDKLFARMDDPPVKGDLRQLRLLP